MLAQASPRGCLPSEPSLSYVSRSSSNIVTSSWRSEEAITLPLYLDLLFTISERATPFIVPSFSTLPDLGLKPPAQLRICQNCEPATKNRVLAAGTNVGLWPLRSRKEGASARNAVPRAPATGHRPAIGRRPSRNTPAKRFYAVYIPLTCDGFPTISVVRDAGQSSRTTGLVNQGPEKFFRGARNRDFQEATVEGH